MKLTSVSIKNYKSIKDSGDLKLHEKINILAGKNNTGKTAFIETVFKVINGKLALGMPNDSNLTSVELDVNVSLEELGLLNENVPSEHIIVDNDKFKIMFIHDHNSNSTYLIEVKIITSNNYIPIFTTRKQYGNFEYLVVNPDTGKTYFYRNNIPTFQQNLISLLKSRVIYISGSRYAHHDDEIELQEVLSTNGTNLNGFLYTLHNNKEDIYDKICKTFTQIFSDVTSLSTPINTFRKTYIDIKFDGMDKPFPLSSCGSGYTHILLFLCVLYTKKDSIVLFDEPQIFLHPSAEKAIYDLVNTIGEHQYFFTTHSPILINYPVNKNLYHVSKDKGFSKFAQLEKMQEILSDIGVSNSDFAMSDKILFVEGETEEIALPLILSHFGMKQIGYNYKVMNFKGTDKEFNKKTAMHKNKQKLDLILSGVSQSPIPYKIIIDADNKSEDKLQELKDSYQNNIVILDRREYENYFLNSFQEIAEIMNEEKGVEIVDKEVIKREIEQLISKTDDIKLYPRKPTDHQKDVVGSEVFERLFDNHSLNYNKVRHGYRLTVLVLERNPETLQFFKNELQDFLQV